MRFIFVAFFLCMALVTGALGADDAGNRDHGKVVYERYCMTCHGERGNGGGELAPYLNPKPRDFRKGVFKWRSTPSGSLPLISDLERTVGSGVYWTAMPSFYVLNARARADVIAYIQTFSERWASEQPGPPLLIPPEPANKPASVERGRDVYGAQSCAKCHGDQGMGDGESSKTLIDDWGNPIVPFDLTKGHMKGGSTSQDLYRVFMTGLNGTPMPSFSDTIKPDEAWDLVHYIQSLNAQNRRRK
jgi:mono/diheme cytochrome c family protein